MTNDYVDLRDFNSTTAHAIRQLYSSNGWEELDNLVSPESAALMFFRLRATPDTGDNFPHGKWATIQHLEEIITRLSALTPSPTDADTQVEEKI